jgi:hypothetical protein
MSNELDKARKAQAVINAYHRVFATPEGALVLGDIRAALGLHMPAFIPQTRGRHCEYDAIHAAIRDGQRQVILHIEAKLTQTPDGDANVEAAKTRVKK